jgi:hypothetical protein
MSCESELAARYRIHAEELRTIADADGLEETRRMLMDVAARYEKMARIMYELDFIHKKRQVPAAAPPLSYENHPKSFSL